MTSQPLLLDPLDRLEDPIERLEARTEIHRERLRRSLDALETAMKSSLPTEAVKRRVDHQPYQMVGMALGLGVVAGLLL